MLGHTLKPSAVMAAKKAMHLDFEVAKKIMDKVYTAPNEAEFDENTIIELAVMGSYTARKFLSRGVIIDIIKNRIDRDEKYPDELGNQRLLIARWADCEGLVYDLQVPPLRNDNEARKWLRSLRDREKEMARDMLSNICAAGVFSRFCTPDADTWPSGAPYPDWLEEN